MMKAQANEKNPVQFKTFVQAVERSRSTHHEVNVPEHARRLTQKSFVEFIMEPWYKLSAQAVEGCVVVELGL